jgi:hypothetical protein
VDSLLLRAQYDLRNSGPARSAWENFVMGLFISYSSRDGAALAKVTAALRRAHIEAWLDEELTGGEAWWNAILEQIRGCEVFIAALSKNYLESKPCQAELRYAQDLGRPILPVQIGPLDSMRVNPLASVQAIDYQNPSIDSGIELIAAVHARKVNAAPLPSPLPEPPPVPFAYLMRLNTAIAAPELSAAEQAQLFSDLNSGLDTDGHEPSARRDLIQLLIRLRDRPDITWKTRTDVEKVLTAVQAEDIPHSSRSTDASRPPSVGYSAPAPPVGAGPAPPFNAAPPPAGSAGGRRFRRGVSSVLSRCQCSVCAAGHQCRTPPEVSQTLDHRRWSLGGRGCGGNRGDSDHPDFYPAAEAAANNCRAAEFHLVDRITDQHHYGRLAHAGRRRDTEDGQRVRIGVARELHRGALHGRKRNLRWQ